MGIYILVGILYILLLGAFYIGFKEFTSFKEDYYKDKNFSFTKFQNLEDFYNKTESQTQNVSKLVESYKEDISKVVIEYEKLKLSYENYIKDNQEQVETIKKVYKDDKVMENFHHMLDLMNKFQKDQDLMKSYLSDSVYKLEKYPEKKHLELKRILNVNNSKLKEIESILPKIQIEIEKYQNYFTKELSSIKNVYNNRIK